MPSDPVIDGGIIISTELRRVQEPEELLRLLKAFGFTDEDIAQATSTRTRSVRRWKETVLPGTSAAARLGELRNLVLILRESRGLTDRGIVYWLRHPNRLLEDYSPFAVLGAGGFRSVRSAALCFVDTDRAFDEPLSGSVSARLRAADGVRAAQQVASTN
jgi:hypothetical protein